jgi:hypothetical protein
MCVCVSDVATGLSRVRVCIGPACVRTHDPHFRLHMVIMSSDLSGKSGLWNAHAWAFGQHKRCQCCGPCAGCHWRCFPASHLSLLLVCA